MHSPTRDQSMEEGGVGGGAVNNENHQHHHGGPSPQPMIWKRSTNVHPYAHPQNQYTNQPQYTRPSNAFREVNNIGGGGGAGSAHHHPSHPNSYVALHPPPNTVLIPTNNHHHHQHQQQKQQQQHQKASLPSDPRTRYSTRDRGDLRSNGDTVPLLQPPPPPPTTAAAAAPAAVSNPDVVSTVPSKDQILRRLFLQKNIDLSTSRKLGAGRYSKVVTARLLQRGKNEEIAIKVINTQKVTPEFHEKFLPREIECWKQLSNVNLVRILGHYEAIGYVFLTMEFGGGGDLLSYVQKRGPIPEMKAAVWVNQILSGVEFMHKLGISHRDLKLENVIVFSEVQVKISDFGFAKQVNDQLSSTYCGSKSYSAPEILLGEPYNPYKADVWSIGVIAYVMVTDCMPYRENQSNKKIVECQRNRAYSYPSRLHLSEQCRGSINKMMTFVVNERPTVSQSKTLPWLLPASFVAATPAIPTPYM